MISACGMASTLVFSNASHTVCFELCLIGGMEGVDEGKRWRGTMVVEVRLGDEGDKSLVLW